MAEEQRFASVRDEVICRRGAAHVGAVDDAIFEREINGVTYGITVNGRAIQRHLDLEAPNMDAEYWRVAAALAGPALEQLRRGVAPEVDRG